MNVFNEIESAHLSGLVRILAYRLGGEIEITEEELTNEEIVFKSTYLPDRSCWIIKASHPLDRSAEEVVALRARLKDLD